VKIEADKKHDFLKELKCYQSIYMKKNFFILAKKKRNYRLFEITDVDHK